MRGFPPPAAQRRRRLTGAPPCRCIPDAAIDAHVDAQLALVRLEGSRDARANTLSGGMQRRLSVAMSLVGDPQIVLLGARRPARVGSLRWRVTAW